MSTDKKARSDANLKTLSAEQQEEIYSRLTVKTAEWKNTSIAAVQKWLHEDGIETSNRALSEFFSWYSLQSQFRQDEQTTESLLEQLRRDMPGLTEEQLDDLGQRTFSLLAIRRGDLPGFVSIRSARTNAELERAKLKLKERAEARQEKKLKLEREKFELQAAEKMLNQALREQAERIANSNLSNADKIAAMRKAAFSDVDALEASGEIKLPKRT